MTIRIFKLLAGLCVLVTAAAAQAQIVDECDIDPSQPKCAVPPSHFPLYCKNDIEADFRLGLDENFNIEFRFTFTGGSPGDHFDVLFRNGLGATGRAVEAKVTRVRCDKQKKDGTQICSGVLLLADEPALTEKFDTDQAVINVVLVRNKDVCLSKFTNAQEKVAAETRLLRSYCTFYPASDSSLSGEGFFDVRGYGSQGEAHFQMLFAGFESGKSFSGCIPGKAGKFQEILNFTPHAADQSDAEIYGNNLSAVEQQKLADEATDYSYDLLRAADQAQAQSRGTRISFSGSALSSINYTVSSDSADRERSNSNSSSRRDEKRNRKKKGHRGNNRIFSALVSAARGDKTQAVFGWMGFDPLLQDVLIAPKCSGYTEDEALGTLRCGDDQGGERHCSGYRSDELGEDGNPLIRGNVCLEPRGPFTLLLVRAIGLTPGEYRVCLGDSELSSKLVSADDNGVIFGELQVTDSALVNNATPDIVLFDGDLSAVTQVRVGLEEGCADALIQSDL